MCNEISYLFALYVKVSQVFKLYKQYSFPSCGLRFKPILAYVDIKTCCFTTEFEFCILLLFLRAASQLQQNCTSGNDVFFTWKLIINFWTVTRTS